MDSTGAFFLCPFPTIVRDAWEATQAHRAAADLLTYRPVLPQSNSKPPRLHTMSQSCIEQSKLKMPHSCRSMRPSIEWQPQRLNLTPKRSRWKTWLARAARGTRAISATHQ